MKNPQSIGDQVTPLHLAAIKGHWKICELFFAYFSKLKEDASKNPKNSKGDTPLHWAANYGHMLVCQVILDNIKDKNPSNDEGLTPFDFAIEQCFFAICNLISSSNNMEL